MSKLYAPPGHFYSPIPDPEEIMAHLQRLAQWKVKPLAGINLDDELLQRTWDAAVPHMQRAPFSHEANARHRYYWRNPFYAYGDGAFYFALLAERRPARIIEIGSGYSTALALDAREILELDAEITAIEPYPDVLRTLLRTGDFDTIRLITDKVQNVDLAEFSQLDRNDILFIDSSHVLKTGSDVCSELFEILPSLKPGVIVHFHDVFYPFEYPESWLLRDCRAWNELYGLRAFLMYNSAFRIFFFNDYFRVHFPELIAGSQTVFGLNPGGGLWLTVV